MMNEVQHSSFWFSTATRDVLWPPITGSLSASHLCLSFGSAPEAKETSGMLDDGEAGATAAAAVVALRRLRERSARGRGPWRWDGQADGPQLVVSACGFDSIPADIGTLYTMQEFATAGGVAIAAAEDRRERYPTRGTLVP